MLSEKDLRIAHAHRLAKIHTYIKDNWSNKNGQVVSTFDAYAYLFQEILDDLRKDFLTGVSFYKNPNGKVVPIENDVESIKSFATTVGLNSAAVYSHLHRYLNFLSPRWMVDIPTWDGVDRVRTLCLSTVVENLSRECFYEHVLDWGAGIFGRAHNPTFQNKVLILRGPQGIGKDFFIKTICKSLGPYFGTWTNTRDERELIMLMERSLVLNVPEFDNTHKNEVAMLKALITKYQATYRSPYARKAESVDLRTSFISSANVEYLLRDSTGNRRYLIFVVNKFDLMDKFDGFDSLQILAQFKHAHETGFRVSDNHSLAMRSYIESQTPQSFEEQVIEAWVVEVSSLSNFLNPESRFPPPADGWWRASRLANVFEKMKKDFGIGRNHLSILLQNRGLKTKKHDGAYYRATPEIDTIGRGGLGG